jgi:hypothetical protein
LLVAVALVGTLFGLTRLPALPPDEKDALAASFRFNRLPLPEVANHPPYKYVRKVHPSVQHIDAYLSTLGAAVALGDLDGDGLPNDIVWVDPRTDQVICAPAPGTSPRYAPFALDPGPDLYDPETMCPTGCLITDMNEDGLMDVLVLYWGRTPIAFLRKKPADPKAPPTAADFVAQEIVPGNERWYSTTATTADLDGDGHLDLILGNYTPDGSRTLHANARGFETMFNSLAKSGNGGGARFFRWVGGTSGDKPSVRYEEQPVLSGDAAKGWTLALGAADLDGDGLPEVYIANDFGPDRLLHNRSRPGRFEFAILEGQRHLGTPASFVLGQDSFKGMGVDFGDVNGDGLLDIYVSNLTGPYALQESHFLWLSTGETQHMKQGIAPYRQASEELGLSRTGWAWDCRLLDLNNDGVLEAIQATGFLKGKINRWPELQSLAVANPQLLHNPAFWPNLRPGSDVNGHDTFAFFVRAKDGRYYDMAPELGLAEAMVSRGIAVADVDGDGRLDFAIANQWEVSYLYHNQCPNPGNFLGLHLTLPLERGQPTIVKKGLGHPVWESPSRPAVGAAVTARLPNGRKLVAQVDGGSGFAGRRSPDVHLGLAEATEAAVEIRWRDPSGQLHEETFNLKAGWHTIQLAWPGAPKGDQP